MKDKRKSYNEDEINVIYIKDVEIGSFNQNLYCMEMLQLTKVNVAHKAVIEYLTVRPC